jgi:phosphate transport system substrate-binding protein
MTVRLNEPEPKTNNPAQHAQKKENNMNKTTIIAGSLIALLASGPAQAEDKLVLDGSTTVGPIAKAFAEYYMAREKGVNVTVSESGSGNGAKSLLNGTCDIACMSRAMKDSEIQAAVEKKVAPVQHVVAFDGLPMLVHPSNPVKALTRKQIEAIYTGEIANWKDVGGLDLPIVVVSRDTNSGTYETFKELVLSKDAKIKAGAEYTGSNGAIRQRVQSTQGAIGYAGLGFVDQTVKALAVDGILPSVETVIAGTYPLSRKLFMYTNGQPAKESHVAKFIDLARQPKGKEIVEEIGFVPLQD